jgi:hypothetical protein
VNQSSSRWEGASLGGQSSLQRGAQMGALDESHRACDHCTTLRNLAAAGPVLLLLFCTAGCGDNHTRRASVAAEPTSVKQCLVKAGLRVTGGAARPIPGDDDAPDRGELITSGTFIAFYSSSTRAAKLAPAVRARARHYHGTVSRRGAITVLYLRTRNGIQRRVEACLPS